MIRTDQTVMAKKIFGSTPESRRKYERPRLRCMEDVKNDTRELKVN
jgi:hypothetical protein